MSLKQTRRSFLKIAAFVGSGALAANWLAGCAPQPAPAPAATAKPAAQAPAAAPTAAKAPAAKVELRFMERGDALGEFMRHASRVYEEQNPGITVKNEATGWGDLTTKVPTYVAAGTMADLAYQHNAFMLPELAKKGAWLDLTSLADAEKHDFAQYYPWAVNSLKQGPKDELVAMPMGVHNGENEIMWNVELVKSTGLPEPKETMTMTEFNELLVQLQKKMPPKAFAFAPSYGFWGMEAHSRTFGGSIISQDRKKTGFSQAKTQDAHKWMMNMVLTSKVIPSRDQVLKDMKSMFYSGLIAVYSNCAANLWVGYQAATEGKITLGHCMWPHGGGGKVGTTPSCDGAVVYGKTKYPKESWGLARTLASFDISKWAAVTENHMTPGAVVKAWHDAEVVKINPLYGDCANFWDTLKTEDMGSVPVPYNTRVNEYWNMYNNSWDAFRGGDKPLDQAAIDKLQADLQAIQDKAMP